MGAWGDGPFDNDTALDYLDDLADTYGQLDENYNLIPETINTQGAFETLKQMLQKSTVGGPCDDNICEEAYATAGLTASVLVGLTKGGGTRLGEFMASHKGDILAEASLVTDPLGLDSHCGKANLITPEQANELRILASDTTTALLQNEDWLNEWNDPSHIKEQLVHLRTILQMNELT
jgi:hypothetical protein